MGSFQTQDDRCPNCEQDTLFVDMNCNTLCEHAVCMTCGYSHNDTRKSSTVPGYKWELDREIKVGYGAFDVGKPDCSGVMGAFEERQTDEDIEYFKEVAVQEGLTIYRITRFDPETKALEVLIDNPRPVLDEKELEALADGSDSPF